MPVSTFSGLQTSLRGLLAQQRSIDVTGHNIANVNTPGFSRQEAGAALGRPAHEVTLEALCALVSPGAAELARQRSAELRGLLAEIAREHGINRALMRQELAFLSHLTRLLGAEPEGAYAPPAGAPRAAAPSVHRVLDLQA